MNSNNSQTCESVQLALLRHSAGEESLAAPQLGHVRTCGECRAFKECLDMTTTKQEPLEEPSVRLDASVLSYARAHRPLQERRVLAFPLFWRFAAAAVLAVLLSVGGLWLARQDGRIQDSGPVAGADGSEDAVWKSDDISDGITDMAFDLETRPDAYSVLADMASEDILAEFATDIDEELYALQAEVYLMAQEFE
jgi:hypothetical protein